MLATLAKNSTASVTVRARISTMCLPWDRISSISVLVHSQHTRDHALPALALEPVQGHPSRHAGMVVQNRLEHGQQWHVGGALHERRQDLVEASFDPENLRLHIGTRSTLISFGFEQDDLTQLRHILEV